jgi:hypothetical protein
MSRFPGIVVVRYYYCSRAGSRFIYFGKLFGKWREQEELDQDEDYD